VAEYRLRIKASVLRELESVGRQADRRRLVARIRALARQPRPPGCEKLSGGTDRYRVRHGPFRVVYSVDDGSQLVMIVKIGHRRDVYR